MNYLSFGILVAALASPSGAAAPWQHVAKSTYCEISETSAHEKITYTFSSLLGEAGLELSSPKLKPYCTSGTDTTEVKLALASRVLDAPDSQIACSADSSPLPTAIVLIGQLDSPNALSLADSAAVKLTLPASGYAQTFNSAGMKQAAVWLRNCVREHAAEWRRENTSQ